MISRMCSECTNQVHINITTDQLRKIQSFGHSIEKYNLTPTEVDFIENGVCSECPYPDHVGQIEVLE